MIAVRCASHVVILVAFVWMTACGDDGDTADKVPSGLCVGPASGPLLPMVVGARWKYRLTDTISKLTATTTDVCINHGDVGGLRAGTTAFQIWSEGPLGFRMRWKGVEDDPTRGRVWIVYRDRKFFIDGRAEKEKYYFPGNPYLFESATAFGFGDNGFSRTVCQPDCDQPSNVAMDSFESEGLVPIEFDATVTVPAGTFCHVLRFGVNEVDTDDGTIRYSEFWFAPGVGKVKQQTSNTREELVEYALPLM